MLKIIEVERELPRFQYFWALVRGL